MVDAAFGEVLVTCEKIRWLLSEGERWLRPESRSTGRMVGSAATLPYLLPGYAFLWVAQNRHTEGYWLMQ